MGRTVGGYKSWRWAAVAVVVICGPLSGCWLDDDDDDAPNSPPEFSAQRFTGVEDTALYGQLVATDPGDRLTFTAFESPKHGSLTQLSPDGAFRYEPDENYNGTDSFVAEVSDSAQHSVRAEIHLEISAVNDAPALVDDVFTASSTGSLPVLANDSDPEGDALTLESVDTPYVGTATITAEGTVNLQLPPGFNGVTRFMYRVREATGLTSEATALVFVGIDPFKVIYLGTEGVYVNDLAASWRASPEEGSPTRIVSMTAAVSGRAFAYVTGEAAGDTYRFMYVDLAEPGVARQIGPSVAASPSMSMFLYGYRISPDGRYVAFQHTEITPSGMQSTLLLFDAQSTEAPVTLSSIIATRTGLDPQFSADGSHLYYVAAVPDSPGYHAIYRTDLATGSATRVSPRTGNFEGFEGHWQAQNESKLLAVYRRRAVGVFLYSNLFLVDPNQPDSWLPLNPLFSDVTIAIPPTISRDGAYVFFTIFGAIPHPPDIMSTRIVQTAAPTGYQEIGTPATWVGAETQKLDPAHMRADSRALLFTTQWNRASTNLFEVMHDNPAVLTLVNSETRADEAVTSGRYSVDGERIFYIRSNKQTGARTLEITRRSSFGTSTALTVSGDDIAAHQLDPSGRVALIVRGNSPDAPYAVVNADAPQVYLPLDAPGAQVAGTVAVVAR